MIPLKEDLADADLFELGIESLQVIALSKQINAYLERYTPNTEYVTAEIIYAHSTPKDLEKTLANLGRLAERTNEAEKMQGVFEEWLKRPPQTHIFKKRSSKSIIPGQCHLSRISHRGSLPRQ